MIGFGVMTVIYVKLCHTCDPSLILFFFPSPFTLLPFVLCSLINVFNNKRKPLQNDMLMSIWYNE